MQADKHTAPVLFTFYGDFKKILLLALLIKCVIILVNLTNGYKNNSVARNLKTNLAKSFEAGKQ